MLITLKTHKQLEEERTELLIQAVELMKKQARSNHWYAKRMNVIKNKVKAIEDILKEGAGR